MVKKRPHTVVFSWSTEETYDALRNPIEGSDNSVSVACDIQPVTMNARYDVGSSGDEVQAKFKIFANRFTDDTDTPEKGVNAYFLDEDHMVLRFFVFQKHLEAYC